MGSLVMNMFNSIQLAKEKLDKNVDDSD